MKSNALKEAVKKSEVALRATQQLTAQMGEVSHRLYQVVSKMELAFEAIRGIPDEQTIEYKNAKVQRMKWHEQAVEIERSFDHAKVKQGFGAAVAGLGVAVATAAPSVAMGIATTFGVASTGTAISALSGAAATNAALAWLGGGALAAGGGGIALGSTFLTLSGPVGWTIVGLTLIPTLFSLFKGSKEKKEIEGIYSRISERDTSTLKLACTEIKERMKKMDDETALLNQDLGKIETFGIDYNQMSEDQQYQLGSFVNLMSAATQLLVTPIRGLQPLYSENDFYDFVLAYGKTSDPDYCRNHKETILSLCNLLYHIDLSDTEQKTWHKYLRKNKKALASLGISKEEFTPRLLSTVQEALSFAYRKRTVTPA